MTQPTVRQEVEKRAYKAYFDDQAQYVLHMQSAPKQPRSAGKGRFKWAV